ncbi:MAG: penicillin-insensitive murein endopeptidase [Chromatiaceae bacterium]|nr:MAG: penicillin-insensitive murein endopeptidase [Chromatiaceae bacterium]
MPVSARSARQARSPLPFRVHLPTPRPWRRAEFHPIGTGLIWIALLALLTSTSTHAAPPWSQIRTAAPGRPEAIGAPANGCLRGAVELPASGPGYVSVRRERHRHFGHPDTVSLVSALGRTMAARNGRLIMVGDLAQPRGGRMDSLHVSHQNGLDVDIWFALANSPKQAWRDTPEGRNPPSMVAGEGLSQHWGPDQLFLLRTTAEHPAVDRVLINPRIKRALCQDHSGAPWLRRLRPWHGHDAHMHIRLRCPADSPDCEQQAPIPPGDGCGGELAWWFSAEARTPHRGPSRPAPTPPPPAACRTLLPAT